jgi:hypothetical protein
MGQADFKMNQCVLELTEHENTVEDVCGHGVDPGFDQLISALGHIARQNPKYLIDYVMWWRKEKADEANKARSDTSMVFRVVGSLDQLLNLCRISHLDQANQASHVGTQKPREVHKQPLHLMKLIIRCLHPCTLFSSKLNVGRPFQYIFFVES